MKARHILYIQFANPGAYPPVCHSSRILANHGWKVHHFGLNLAHTHGLNLPSHTNITSRLFNMPESKFGRIATYQQFFIESLAYCLKAKPSIIYASDPQVTPVAVALAKTTGLPIVYHEHDLPGDNPRLVRKLSRELLAQDANLRIFPNNQRAEIFKKQTNSTKRYHRVFNCPALSEVAQTRHPKTDEQTLIYHGSIVPARIPFTVIEALARSPRIKQFTIIGYETMTGIGHVENLHRRAKELGCLDKLHYLGRQPREVILQECTKAHIGISLFDLDTLSENDGNMAGASVKVFEYLSQGVVPLVNQGLGWEEEFINPGFALGTNPNDVVQLTNSLNKALELRSSRWENDTLSQLRSTWNYEHQFEKVLPELDALLETSPLKEH